MTFSKSSSRLALCVFAAALLLKAAMPWLASVAAHAQGKTLVEVCTVYGVSLVPQLAQDQEPANDHAPTHGADHCALTALTALATPGELPLAVLAVTLRATRPPLAHPSSQAPDACATWVARLKHGPPTLS